MLERRVKLVQYITQDVKDGIEDHTVDKVETTYYGGEIEKVLLSDSASPTYDGRLQLQQLRMQKADEGWDENKLEETFYGEF